MGSSYITIISVKLWSLKTQIHASKKILISLSFVSRLEKLQAEVESILTKVKRSKLRINYVFDRENEPYQLKDVTRMGTI